MSEQNFHDPDAEGVARAAQVAANSLTITEALARLQQERTLQRSIDDERTAAAARADKQASHAAARVAWTPALNDRWLQRADVPQLLGAWSPAVAWSTSDPDAHDAADRTEQRLAEMHPEAMRRYFLARGEGMDPAAAMGKAAPAFATADQERTHVVRADRQITAGSRVISGQTITPARQTAQSPARHR